MALIANRSEWEWSVADSGSLQSFRNPIAMTFGEGSISKRSHIINVDIVFRLFKIFGLSRRTGSSLVTDWESEHVGLIVFINRTGVRIFDKANAIF